MTRLLIFAVLWSPLAASACCHPSTVTRPVLVTPPACRSADHPEPPVGAVAGTQRWADWFAFDLVPWILATEHECPRRVRATRKPDPGPAWWTRQPSGAVGE